MNQLILRIGAILLHLLLNVIAISWLTNFDISGNWLSVLAFVIVLFILLALFIRHLISFFIFRKN
jgi:membrane protein YdbS with pleckstrin-like domain